ncbi:MAG: hypothetical protein PHH68_02535 [Candidatus Omnitrophica bacterium]|jgi:hypothetical protein|nr:hypothetical protein [Candidatus Omnitrophota bacterium]MDD5079186.1 hypothetical protein [Candidatus Omnitrophota bacterium]
MKRIFGIAAAVISFFILPMPAFGQLNADLYNPLKPALSSSPQAEMTSAKLLFAQPVSCDYSGKTEVVYTNWFDALVTVSRPDENEDRRKIRNDWKEFFGVDVFLPYYKAQEVEEFIQEKVSVKLFNVKGRPEYDRQTHQVKYIFKRKF